MTPTSLKRRLARRRRRRKTTPRKLLRSQRCGSSR